jgi:hypothetical protein
VKRDTISQRLIEKKHRQLSPEIVYSHVMERISKLEALADTDFFHSGEFERYIPKAIVAALESLYETILRVIVDDNKEYKKEVIAIMANLKRQFDPDVLFDIQDGQFTIGDIVAYLVKFNKMEDMLSTLQRFSKQSITEVIEGVAREFGEEKGRVFFELDRIFITRHILAHETSSNINCSNMDAVYFLKCAKILVNAISRIFLLGNKWSVSEDDANDSAPKVVEHFLPISIEELNSSALERFQTKQSELRSAQKAVTCALVSDKMRGRYPDLASLFAESELLWEKYAKKAAESYAFHEKDSVLYKMILLDAKSNLLEQRIEFVGSYFMSVHDLS